jgi:two-component system, OmpR family, response regulator
MPACGTLVKKLLNYPQKQTMTQAKLQTKELKKILIVEDEGDMCLLLNIMLSEKETDLEHVKSLSAAKEYLQNKQPSVVILDNKLPDGYGIDFIGFIKKNYPSVKIVMISGFGASAKDIALHNGADLFLEKPFSKEEMYQSVQTLLN